MPVFRYPDPRVYRRRIRAAVVVCFAVLAAAVLVRVLATMLVQRGGTPSAWIEYILQPHYFLLMGVVGFLAAVVLVRFAFARYELNVHEEGIVRKLDTLRDYVRWEHLREVISVEPPESAGRAIVLTRTKGRPIIVSGFPNMDEIFREIRSRVPGGVSVRTVEDLPYRERPRMWWLVFGGAFVLALVVALPLDRHLFVPVWFISFGAVEWVLRQSELRAGYMPEYVYLPRAGVFLGTGLFLMVVYVLGVLAES